jgi:hypothetical protein
MTALPHPPKVSQNVPIASATYDFVFISRASFDAERLSPPARCQLSAPTIAPTGLAVSVPETRSTLIQVPRCLNSCCRNSANLPRHGFNSAVTLSSHDAIASRID